MNSFGTLYKLLILENSRSTTRWHHSRWLSGWYKPKCRWLQLWYRKEEGWHSRRYNSTHRSRYPVFLWSIQRQNHGAPLPLFLRIAIPGAVIMKSKEVFHVPAMQILWLPKVWRIWRLPWRRAFQWKAYRLSGGSRGWSQKIIISLWGYQLPGHTYKAGAERILKLACKAIDAKDSIGGIVECRVNGSGHRVRGEPFFNSLESLISHAVLLFRDPWYRIRNRLCSSFHVRLWSQRCFGK